MPKYSIRLVMEWKLIIPIENNYSYDIRNFSRNLKKPV